MGAVNAAVTRPTVPDAARGGGVRHPSLACGDPRMCAV